MPGDDDSGTGVPTRAIHEAYIKLQQNHRTYREAVGGQADEHAARGSFQDAILTFYELVRPHLKHESALSDYWAGNLPDYTGWEPDSAADAVQTVRDKGTGVYQVQTHTAAPQLNREVMTDGGPQSFADWHDTLGLSWDTERLVSVGTHDDQVFAQLLRVSVLPLRELDHWQVVERQERTSGEGFMAGEGAVQTRYEYEPGQKLVAAKRLLVEAADKLGALSEFDASSQLTEITREDIEDVEEWRQNQLND